MAFNLNSQTAEVVHTGKDLSRLLGQIVEIVWQVAPDPEPSQQRRRRRSQGGRNGRGFATTNIKAGGSGFGQF